MMMMMMMIVIINRPKVPDIFSPQLFGYLSVKTLIMTHVFHVGFVILFYISFTEQKDNIKIIKIYIICRIYMLIGI
jgi:hypothetical protein